MSRSGTPTDNPVIEPFNSWFKPLLYYTFGVYYKDSFYETVASCTTYWNNERKTYRIVFKNPVQFRTELGFI